MHSIASAATPGVLADPVFADRRADAHELRLAFVGAIVERAADAHGQRDGGFVSSARSASTFCMIGWSINSFPKAARCRQWSTA